LIILLFGPPGCGKGTQSSCLAARFGIPAISTGEMFRAESKAGSDLGRMAASILASGGLVSDDVVNAMVANRIAHPDCARGFLLDGYPRTVGQARFLERLIAKSGWTAPTVIHLKVAAEVLVKRLAARRQCPKCLRIYNLISQPPVTAGKCDHDGSALLTREDDRAPVIRQRLREYEDATGPVLQWYGSSAVHCIEGTLEPRLVTDAIEGVLAAKYGVTHSMQTAANRAGAGIRHSIL
jgi:adenylate kinase